MRIYSMTATFGKLDHEVLTLQPGLNILEAPNEWGKSTWCAFLTAMLYSLDTRAKTTKTTLSDKEHFAPWSGKPMSGRMDLDWNGRDITIERTTKGRVPLGVFRAFETHTGLEIPELNGTNCGQMLLGIERSVFLRSGFIRLSDLPVSDDESLRRRLNALVTTGDESGRAERLASGLKELKNRIRYNRTGLLPQAESARDQLEHTLRELMQLETQLTKAQERVDQITDWQLLLENHRAALLYTAAQKNAVYIRQAEENLEEARQHLDELDARCALYPDKETAEQMLEEIEGLRKQQQDLNAELAALKEPDAPESLSGSFAGMTAEEAIASATADRNIHRKLSKRNRLLPITGILLTGLGSAAAFRYLIPGILCDAAGILLLLVGMFLNLRRRNRRKKLEAHYGGQDPNHWIIDAEAYAAALSGYEDARQNTSHRRWELDQLLTNLETHIDATTEGRGLDLSRETWQRVLSHWNRKEMAQQTCRQAEIHCRSLKAMEKSVPAPEFPDRMDYTEAETTALLAECAAQRRQLEHRIGQLQGRMDILGDPADLRYKLDAANKRIRELEKTYTALILAQDTLGEASAQLQRRFAPKIASRAQELMSKLTGGRYDRLKLSDDLSLRAGEAREDILREALWRSDGTADQLYLALRLAVAEELAPEAPLILDDALVRFDNLRLKAALEILKEEAETKQVLLFTCHSREKELV